MGEGLVPWRIPRLSPILVPDFLLYFRALCSGRTINAERSPETPLCCVFAADRPPEAGSGYYLILLCDRKVAHSLHDNMGCGIQAGSARVDNQVVVFGRDPFDSVMPFDVEPSLLV